jgi:hypothetical protein
MTERVSVALKAVSEDRRAAFAVFITGLAAILCHPDVLNLVPKQYSEIATGVAFILQAFTKSLFGGGK